MKTFASIYCVLHLLCSNCNLPQYFIKWQIKCHTCTLQSSWSLVTHPMLPPHVGLFVAWIHTGDHINGTTSRPQVTANGVKKYTSWGGGVEDGSVTNLFHQTPNLRQGSHELPCCPHVRNVCVPRGRAAILGYQDDRQLLPPRPHQERGNERKRPKGINEFFWQGHGGWCFIHNSTAYTIKKKGQVPISPN